VAAPTPEVPTGEGAPGMVTYIGQAKPKRIDHMVLPLRLTIPRLEVEAPILSVGLTATFAMDVPQRAEDVGWYEYSTRPGMKGNSILAGHLDWKGGPGVFWRLSALRKGDAVVVRGADGDERPYAVEWNREWSVAAAPIALVFEPLDQPALTLITCGGRWNPSTQRYDTRVVVRAFRV
jgi:sortase A